MSKKKHIIIAGIAFIIALFLIDSPYWGISYISVAVMGAAVVRGQLWDYDDKENEQ
jgi:hypothetical protein